MTTAQAYEAVRELIGRDNEMNARYFAPFLLVMPEVLHAIGAIDDPANAPVLLEQDGARTVAVLQPSGQAAMMPSDTDVSWAQEAGWVDMRGADGPGTPLWLRGNPQEPFRFEYVPDSRTAYVQLNRIGDGDKESIAAFATRLRAFVDSGAVDRLVLDLRLNRGGDGTLNQPLVVNLIRSAKLEGPGRLFVLIGRSTFSAASFLVHDLEAYTDAVFVGEPTAGRPTPTATRAASPCRTAESRCGRPSTTGSAPTRSIPGNGKARTSPGTTRSCPRCRRRTRRCSTERCGRSPRSVTRWSSAETSPGCPREVPTSSCRGRTSSSSTRRPAR